MKTLGNYDKGIVRRSKIQYEESLGQSGRPITFHIDGTNQKMLPLQGPDGKQSKPEDIFQSVSTL